MNRIGYGLIGALGALLVATVLYAQSQVTGTVVDSASGQGVGGLTVNLSPANGAKGSDLGTATNSKGGFSFSGGNDGRYSRAVYHGVTPLHRRVVEVRGNLEIGEIRLQRR